VAALAVVLLTIVSVGAASAAAPKPKRGGIFTMVHTGDTNGFDPIIGTANIIGDGVFLYPVFDMLLLENPVTGAIEPKIATSLASKDGVHWTLKLHPGVKFTDGTPYDANAVKFNWTRALTPTNTSQDITFAQQITDMTATNATTLNFTLKAKDPQFSNAVATTSLGLIGSPTAIQKESSSFSTNPVGAGPFMLKSWTRGTGATFTRNPNYWVKGEPYFDGLQIMVSAVASTRTNDYLSHSVDAASLLIPGAQKQALIAVPGTRIFLRDGDIGSTTLMFNEKKPPFDSLLARQAAAAAFNMKGYNQAAQFGGQPKYMFRKPSPFFDPKIPITQTYNPAKAQQLLNQYAAQTGGPLTFKLTTTTINPLITDYFISQLGQFTNLKVTPDVIDITQLGKKLVGGDFNLTLSLLGRVPTPGYAFYNSLFTGAATNFWGYSNPTMDKALEAGILAAPGSPAQIAAYKTVQQTINSSLPLLWLPLSGAGDAVSPKVGGAAGHRYPNSWLFEQMWFK
jgi:peptide/nickel transport system substrate-binding protein